MLTLRKANERGKAKHGWLESYHTFSFANYYDREHLGFRDLRVINEDYIDPHNGFGTHPHKDMEIITYVIEGALTHKDSTGSEGVLRPGVVQRMSAGTGISHSEMNDSEMRTHLYQIWINTEKKGIRPSYEEKAIAQFDKNGLHLLASPNGKDDSLTINQQVYLYAGKYSKGQEVQLDFANDRYGWLQLIKGKLKVDDLELNTSDGLSISHRQKLLLEICEESEFLLFDLP